MKICIPSKHRAETLSTHLFFSSAQTLIFVEPQEINKYKIFHPEYTFISIEKNDQGVSYARNYILDYVGDENIIMADDDYEFFGKRNNTYHYDRAYNYQEIVDSIDTQLSKYVGYGICDNDFSYYKNKITKNKRFYVNSQILMDFYGLNMKWLNKHKIRYDEKLKEGEDSDLTIMILLNEGLVCTDYLYSRRLNPLNLGGLASERNGMLTQDHTKRRYVKYLTRKYGTEFISTRHDRKGYLVSYTIKFELILKRPDIVRENIKMFDNDK